MSPLLAFDIRHDWMNSRALYKFLTVRDETVAITPWTAFPKIYPIYEQVVASMLTAKQELVGKLISILLVIFGAFVLSKKTFNNRKSIILILNWLVFRVDWLWSVQTKRL